MPWVGAQVEIFPKEKPIVVSVPAGKIEELKAACAKWLAGPGMIGEKDLRAFAGRGSWLGGIAPQVRPFYRQIWGALAAPRQPGKENLVYKKQVESALARLLSFAEARAMGLTRKVCAADKHFRGCTVVTDASPWGGGAVSWPSWDAYTRWDTPTAHLQLAWDERHEKLISGKIGSPEYRAAWGALMVAIAMRTWIDEKCRGIVTIVGDASGVLGDVVAMRAKSDTVNDLIKELALHIAPYGLEVQGLHIWSERNVLADTLSRVANGEKLPPWLGEMGVRRATPMSPEPRRWQHCCRRLPSSASQF